VQTRVQTFVICFGFELHGATGYSNHYGSDHVDGIITPLCKVRGKRECPRAILDGARWPSPADTCVVLTCLNDAQVVNS